MYYIITNIHNYVWYTYRHNINLWEIPKKPPFFLHIIQRPDEHNVLQLPPSVVACSQGHYKVPKTHQCGVIVPKDTCDDVVPKLEFWFTWAFLSRSMLECGHFQRLPLKSVPSHIIFSLSTSASLSSSLLSFSFSLPSFLPCLSYLLKSNWILAASHDSNWYTKLIKQIQLRKFILQSAQKNVMAMRVLFHPKHLNMPYVKHCILIHAPCTFKLKTIHLN